MNSSKQNKSSKLKQALEVIMGLLAIVKWLPVGSWRQVALALSAVLGVVVGIVEKCDSTQSETPQTSPSPTVTAPTPTPTPLHTPSPTPPAKPEIVVDRVPQVKWPFTVRYTAQFEFNTYLWIDKYKLQVLGLDSRTGHMVAPAVTLNTAGRRRLTVRNIQGDVLAEKWIDVNP